MGNYQQAIAESGIMGPDITKTRSYSNNKYGFAVNTELIINANQGVFARLSWNDGKNETWAFTEIDKALTLGYSLKGNAWHRSSDEIGIAGIFNGLSKDHKDYLEAGGYGFIIGDGGLNYGLEIIPEVYYKITINKFFALSADYQVAINPAYNKDNGPINFFSFRAHIAF
jgi:high affinity Mn2+ porin